MQYLCCVLAFFFAPVSGWASYYKLADHCRNPLVEGEKTMGAKVKLSDDRKITLLTTAGDPLECGSASIR